MRRGKGGTMNNNLWSLITAFLKQRMRNKRWRRAVTCLAAVVVFGVTYALILPAITMTNVHPTLSAEQLSAWSGDVLTVKVTAETEEEKPEQTFVLKAEGEGADLSASYVFNEEGICIITDDEGNEIELHRSVREDKEKVVDYWFTLEAGKKTSFTLDLIDEVDSTRFAEIVEAVKTEEDSDKNIETATASDAGKSETAAAVVHDETKKATASNAVAVKASDSNADIRQANAAAKEENEKIVTESDDDGFVQILDGAVINDIEVEEEEEEQTEVVATLKLSAGIGKDFRDAVKDAEKNADKRGDAELAFEWKEIIAKKAAAPKLVSYVDGAVIAVFYDENAGIPENAALSVSEFEKGTEEYAEYLAQAKAAVANATASDASKAVTQARFFDISILDENGDEIEPQSAVKVIITYDEGIKVSEDADLNVVHFKQDAPAPEVFAPVQVENGNENGGLSFITDSFSVYGIVGLETLTAKYITEKGETYEVTVTYDATSGIPEEARLAVSELTPDSKEYSSYVAQTAERINSDASQIHYIKLLDISIVDKAGADVPLDAPVDVKIRLLDKGADKSAESVPETTSVVHFGEKPEVLQSTAEGDAVSFKTEGFSVYAVVTVEQLADLDGKTYGILNTQGGTSPTGSAMMSTASGKGLQAKATTVRINTVDRVSNVYVAQNSNVTMWTFSKADDEGRFFITTVIGTGDSSQTKYLQLSSSGLKLVDAVTGLSDPDCRIKITKAETGTYAGKYKFSTDNGKARLNGKVFDSAAATAAENTYFWMDLAELSTLNDDDFVVYTATKTSVSGTPAAGPGEGITELSDGTFIDYDVDNGEYVILYTRIWNEDTKRYDYYAIDYDGMLVKAYENGDTISWVGSKVNTMIWDFTEYYYENNPEGKDIPNYYYELQNDYSNLFIAPKRDSEEFLSDSKIGLNLNGRRYKEYFTTILAWDKKSFSYRTLKVDKDGQWKLVSAPMSQAADFYFAKMTPTAAGTNYTTVSTLDHESYGITLKMQNYGQVSGERSLEQDEVVGKQKDSKEFASVPDLVKKNLEENGYPICTKTNKSLYELYDEAFTVNQQFLLSTYEETGYFEFDSTKNFAHVITSDTDPWYGQEKPGGDTYGLHDFVVYDQLGTTSEVSSLGTREHGQFFPFNDLKYGQGITAPANRTNATNIHGEQLSTLDPRRGEQLYVIQSPLSGHTKHELPSVDHFFGMEMSASFMQSADGLDDWGHDLIFEFSGDDDFWLYVDDMLVLDLGGIHSAIDGDVNFRTGVVHMASSVNHGVINTDLRELYKAAYKQKNPGATTAQINEFLDGVYDEATDSYIGGYFKPGTSVFKDYSGHSMRMFYMERGAGASNLHMRFNLAPWVDGQVELEKEVTGSDNITTPFPYQIYFENGQTHVWGLAGTDGYPVTVKDSATNAEISPATHTIGSKTYENVFFVNPGQTVKISLPSEQTHYSIVECGVNTDTFDQVSINGTVLNDNEELEIPIEEGIKDYRTDPVVIQPAEDLIRVETVNKRKKVIYDNHVSPNALKSLTVSKRLWADLDKTSEITAPADTTRFRFRIFIGKESNGDYKVYNTGDYYVKNKDGQYCHYNEDEGGFVPFKHDGAEITDLSTVTLSTEELEEITFQTSPNGAADDIQAGFSIEIPGLIAGTPFKIEERDDEIPSGYNRLGYTYTEGKYTPDNHGTETNEGVISSDPDKTDETISVHNQHGYGLTLNKVWSDAAFMTEHDPVYFAVYVGDSTEPLDNSARKLTDPATSISWFLPQLEEGHTIGDYNVYEVELDNPDEDPTTKVVTYDRVIRRIEGGDTTVIYGKDSPHSDSRGFTYTVNYNWGTPEQGANSKTDTVTNMRPGIKILKEDTNGNKLEGAVFDLSEILGVTKTFTSDEEGLVVVGYFKPDTETEHNIYTLVETDTPYGYEALIGELKLKVQQETDNTTTVFVSEDGGTTWVDTADDPDGPYTIENNGVIPTITTMPTITIKNRKYDLKAKKIDALSEEPMGEVHFSLYKEVFASGPNGEPDPSKPMPYYLPMSGYEDLVTGSDGIIPKIWMRSADHPDGLIPGNYYLRENEKPVGYNPLEINIRISISNTGQVTLKKATPPGSAGGAWVIRDFGADEDIAEVGYDEDDPNVMLITVKNMPNDPIRILKLEEGTERVLSNVGFELYHPRQVVYDETSHELKPKADETPLVTGKTDANGILYLTGEFEYQENIGYVLFETEPIEDYALMYGPVIINPTRNPADGTLVISANLYGSRETVLRCEKVHDETYGIEVWQITVYNSKGYQLPSTGGPGTMLYTFGGIALLIASALMYGFRMRRGERRFE